MARRILPTHRTLLGIEAILAVGVAQQWLQELAIATMPHNAWRVLLIMAATAGTFGFLFLGLHWLASGIIDKAVQPAKGRAALFWTTHALVFAGLFYATAWAQHLPVWPMGASLRLPG